MTDNRESNVFIADIPPILGLLNKGFADDQSKTNVYQISMAMWTNTIAKVI